MQPEDQCFSLLYITCQDRAEAEKLAYFALEAKLAASANIISGMTAIYRWKGKMERADETVLLLKTRVELVQKAIAALEYEHSYEIPAILEIPLGRMNESYREWLLKETVAL